MSLTAFALNYTLKMPTDGEESSTDRMLAELTKALITHDVECETARALAHNIKPGVLSDMGEGDDWPKLREKSWPPTSSSLACRSGWANH